MDTDDTTAEVERLMNEHRIRHIPVPRMAAGRDYLTTRPVSFTRTVLVTRKEGEPPDPRHHDR